MDKNKWLDNCRAWCRAVKYLSDELDWAERPNHSGSLQATSAVLDANRATIPFLLFKGEYQSGRMGERISYGLMFRERKEQRRVFMIEVYPSHERSHQEPGKVIFGPHLHLGDPRLEQIVREIKCSLDSVHLKRWVARFRRHAKIMDAGNRRLSPPFAGDLFE